MGGRKPPLSLSKNPRVDKGPQPLMFNPALTTCASERMKTQRFSYFADFAARERMREAKPVKLKKVAFSHFYDTLKGGESPPLFFCTELWVILVGKFYLRSYPRHSKNCIRVIGVVEFHFGYHLVELIQGHIK